MRWDNLTAEGDAERRLPGYRDPALVRTFDAPEALDTRFYEVRSKSALNRVPERSRMPFRWTINPYRGCAHACLYCLAGDTAILMADGRTKPLADLRVGERLYGTVRRGAYRRYAVTEVLAHWSTIKPAYRIVLEDGTELVASGDHRFLTGRGWKHVTGTEQGSARRPHLTVNDELLGTGQFAELAAYWSDLGLLQGLPRDLHLFHLVDPATTRKRQIEGRALKSTARRRVVSVDPLAGELPLFDITTGTGDFIANGAVSHNCFARPTHTYLGLDAGRDFEREIVVKVNVPEVLRTELARPSWKREHVALGTNTDPYQWVEGRYRLMPEIWRALGDSRTPCSVLTKSPLLLRDLDILKDLNERSEVSANFSVPTLDEGAWRATEPHTPSPRARLEAVAKLNAAGIPTGILVAPLMPGINDQPEQVEEILRLAAEAGAVSVGGVALHLRGEVREIFMGWLAEHRPDLLPRYRELYRRGAYAPQEERRRLWRLITWRGTGVSRAVRGIDPAPPAVPKATSASEPSQPSLF